MLFVILAVFVSLSLLVFFHEFGHFIFSKLFSVQVEEFGFGYAPRMFGFVKVDGKWRFFWGKRIPVGKKIGTIYSLNWIPFGGFNRIKDEISAERKCLDSFSARPWWQKSVIGLGGIFFNIILTIILLTIVFTSGYYQTFLEEEVDIPVKNIAFQIIEVQKNSPADQAGLKPDDRILATDGNKFDKVPLFQTYVKNRLSVPITLTIQRKGKILEIQVVPARAAEVFQDETLSGGAIGVGLVKVGRVSYSPPVAFWQAIKRTVSLFYQIVATIIGLLKDLFVGKKVVLDAVGVVGLAAMTGKAAQMGITYLLYFLAIVSLLIAFTQIIPFPAIDGGRIIFYIIEGIRKKPVNYKIEAAVNNIGFVILIILMLFITYRDIIKIATGFF